jgi:DNA-3-methyladenine glycosylase I
VPQHDDRVHFEFLVLEGAQAGLSWDTILRKREHYCKVFDGFDPARIARYDARKVAKLLDDPGIIRNRLKIASTIKNARAFLAMVDEFGTFDKYLWGFIGNKQIVNHRKSLTDLPATSDVSDALSKDLKKRGFTFVGSTIMYSFMQAVGMIDDHLTTCFKAKPARPSQAAARR